MGMPWIETLRERGGPLVDAAKALLRARGEEGLQAGPTGIRRLSELVAQQAARDADEEQDRQFVEGAGALLGLLLLEHTGTGAHRARGTTHRIALGEHGFFDPFGAIEAALDADAPKSELARRVALAEAEARGDGPVARVAGAFARALARVRPDLTIAEQLELDVTLSDGTEVDLARAARATEEEGDGAVEQAAGRIAGMLAGGTPAVPLEEARARLLPRLVPATFVRELADAGRGELATSEVAHDVVCALVLGYEGRVRYVRADELDVWQLDSGCARELAVRNLAARSGDARFARVDTDHGPLLVARTGDGLDAARLLLPGLPDVLAAELTPPFVAAVPHRDILLACEGGRPEMVRALHARATGDAARAPHRISDALFQIGPGGPRPWAGPTAEG